MCGVFGEGQTDYQAEMVEAPQTRPNLDPSRHFVVRVEGDSMDGGNAPIRDGDHILLERQDAEHAGSISGYGRPWAVECRDESGGTSYALKIVQKDDDGTYRLVSRNSSYPDITVDPESLFPVARFVARLDVLEQPRLPEHGD